MRTLTAVVLSTLLGTCSNPPSLLEQIVAVGELRVVTRNSPTSFYYGPDEPLGIEYELARGFAEKLGVDLRIYIADQFWQVFPDVIGGKAHIAAASLTITEPRQDLVAFGPAYQQVEQQVIYRRGTKKPKEIADLLGGRIEVLAGTTHVTVLEQAREHVPELRWVAHSETNPEDLIRKVAHGEIDFTVVDSTSFQLLRNYYPEARAAFGIGPVSSLAWAFSKDAPALRERAASYFAELQATGELKRILDRYYFSSREFDYVGSRAFVRHVDTRLPKYRAMFEEAALDTGIEWRLLAAISYQESHWNPKAVSPTGVRGLMMLTERTAEMMNVADRRDPRESIIGGARYFVRVLKKIPDRISEADRLWLAIAAYNIGFGHVEDGRIITEIQGGDPDQWSHVRERLPLLTDEHWYKRVERGYARGFVPVLYVDNVRRYYQMLQWMTAREILSDKATLITIASNGS